MKRCPDCGETKPLDAFSPWKQSKDGRYTYCRPCATARNLANYAKNRDANNARKRERRKERRLTDEAFAERERELSRQSYDRHRVRRNQLRQLRTWGISREQFDALLERQDGGCAVCAAAFSNVRASRLSIDHDHSCCPKGRSCGKCIRGLLCGNCNTLIGLAGDDPERLLAAARYLRAAETRKA